VFIFLVALVRLVDFVFEAAVLLAIGDNLSTSVFVRRVVFTWAFRDFALGREAAARTTFWVAFFLPTTREGVTFRFFCVFGFFGVGGGVCGFGSSATKEAVLSSDPCLSATSDIAC
jgi:hypothetical protein